MVQNNFPTSFGNLPVMEYSIGHPTLVSHKEATSEMTKGGARVRAVIKASEF
jgi:hypothetical protein